MVELIIEGIQIDLDYKTDIELTYNINDIRNPISTNNTWSKSIDLPGTDVNNDAFSFIYDNNIEVGFNPNLKKECEIRVDSIPVVEGYMRLNEIDIKDGKYIYKIIIYGANTTIFEDMGDALLTDLDLSSYDHTYSKDAVSNSWETTTRDGFYYPYQNYNDTKWSYENLQVSANTYTFFPGFYCSTLVNKIFETYGYTYDSGFFTGATFKSLFIPFNNTSTLTGDIIIAGRREWNDDDVFYRSGTSEYDPGDLYYAYSPGFEPSIQTPSDGYWTFRLQGQTIAGTGWEFLNGYIEVKTCIQGDTFFTQHYKMEIFNSLSYTYQRTFDITYTIPDIIPAGRRIITTSVMQPYHDEKLAGFEYTISWSFNTSVPIFNLTEVKAENTLPVGLKQSDFLKTIITMFNLYVEANPDDKKRLTIEPFDDYYARSTDTIDWTYKVDESNRNYKLMSELNAGSYKFSYKTDSDYLNKLYTDNTNKIVGELIKYTQSNFITKQEKIELTSSPTIIEYLADSDLLIWPSIYKENTSELVGTSGYTGVITTKWNWRILSQNVIYDMPYGITFNSIGWGDFYTASHICNYHGSSYTNGTSLNFDWSDSNYAWEYSNTGGTLYTNYWENYIDLIRNQNSKLLTMDAYLTEQDISKLRFYEKIFIDDCWFYLNQLIYNPLTRQSQVELLLVPATEALTIVYTGFTLSDYTINETETITASVNIINYSQGPENYDFYFRVMSGATLIIEYHKVGEATRQTTSTITQDILFDTEGTYQVICTNGDNYTLSYEVVIVPKYSVVNLAYTPNPATFACNLTISYDVVVVGDWTGTTRIGIRYIDSTDNTDFVFTEPGTQSGSETYNNMSMGTKDFYISDTYYYISEHYYVPIIPRTPAQGDWTMVNTDTLTMNWDSRNECNLGNEWQISSDSGFNTIIQSGTITPYTTLTKTIYGLTSMTEYWTRLRGIYSGTTEAIYSSWSNVKNGETAPMPANLEPGAWAFIPTNPNTAQQGDNVQVRFTVINDGQSSAVDAFFVMRIYADSGKIGLYHSGSTTQTIPVGSTELTFNFNPMISFDIYGPTEIYCEVEANGWFYDTPNTEGYYPFYVQPCTDDVSASLISYSSDPITGNTTQTLYYTLTNNSCHDLLDTDYNVQTVWYSDNGSTIAYYTNQATKYTLASGGGNHTFYTQRALPNTWTTGTKSVKTQISINSTGYVELFTDTYEYYQSEPDIQVVEAGTELISGSTWNILQQNVKLHNYGTGTGTCNVYYIFKKPDGSTLLASTGSTQTIGAGGETTTSNAVACQSGLNGEYSCVWHVKDGTELLGSGTDTYVIDEWATIYWEAISGNDAELKWSGYTAGHSKTLTIVFHATGDTSTSCDCEDPITGQATISLEPGYLGISAYSDCSTTYDTVYDSASVSGITLSGISGSTGYYTTHTTQYTPGYQCGDSTAFVKIKIYSVDVNSGDPGVVQLYNYFSVYNDTPEIGFEY